MAGKKLGVVGLANRRADCRRAAGGFDMAMVITTVNRRRIRLTPIPQRDRTGRLGGLSGGRHAGGQKYRRLVDAAVLRALGAEGFLINIARGSVVEPTR